MSLERTKPLLLPIAALLVFELWSRLTHLQSDSLAPPSAVLAALVVALADLTIPIA
ncbi:MAG: ABC transporter permease, partial [Xanthobacteraceae bacterium]|nr:ABC transporter permease [Xanthobacteraceae bacterium]